MSGRTKPCQLIRTHRRAYLVINACVYGAVLLGMAIGMLFPELHAARADGFTRSQGDLLLAVFRDPLLFTGTILVVNVLRTAVLLIVLPSLVIPFAGLVVFGIKTIDMGIILAPVDRVGALTLIPHSLTLLIEFQAYVWVIFGVWLLGRAWIRPVAVGAPTHRQGYLAGLRALGWTWLPALVLFVIGAIYEVAEIHLLMPLVLGAA
ncbi:hypothetical protein [Microlunatus soli]|uniref:Stage II sporulation protein M n=1 Tax=Microlunatus soli TaxID=630515 RepID=A0A1H1YIU5_9ACTN|nr:hypothetical protein [Microlunatus soli]SDT21342.1 hypothetical protein SAMN04489812_4604 [Microlunatus soli]